MPPFNAQIPSSDGKSFGGYLAKAENPHAPVIVVIQEIFGVNKGLRQMCDQWSKQGYHALCPDLFWRMEPGVELSDAVEAETQKAFDFYKRFDVDQGVKDLMSAVQYARSFDSARVGTIGFCLGGKLAFLMAAQSDADANISYYGGGIDQLLDTVPQIKNPLLIHIGEKDEYIGPAAQDKILAAVAANKKIEAYTYPNAQHAFARVNGVHFDRDAADIANTRSLEFFKKHLMGG